MSVQGYAGVPVPVAEFIDRVIPLPSFQFFIPSSYNPGSGGRQPFDFELNAGVGFRRDSVYLCSTMQRQNMGSFWVGNNYNGWTLWIYPFLRGKVSYLKNRATVGSAEFKIGSAAGITSLQETTSAASEFFGLDILGGGIKSSKGGGLSCILSGGTGLSIPEITVNGEFDSIRVTGEYGFYQIDTTGGGMTPFSATITTQATQLYCGVLSK